MSRLLTDTHAFFWFVYDDPRLSRPAREALGDPGNEVLFSPASVWESAVKASLGRLRLTPNAVEFFRSQAERNGFDLLPIELRHLLPVESLPLRHRGPFDRLLAAQAIVEGITLVSGDEEIRAYPEDGFALLW